ncbi:MAG: DNA topoisomerase IV subunit B [Alphaproteobacteria bacterium]|nr:DNA topoisomerase IV subunit B [Alphaproteobacteria bacterium]
MATAPLPRVPRHSNGRGAAFPSVPPACTLASRLVPPRPIEPPMARAAKPRPQDLFDASKPDGAYSAKDIEVLEGLEPVRRRPGMYIGGTDERALHHLFAEALDNCMDEAVAGHARHITVRLDADGRLTVADDGRGIPVDPHPKFPKKSALEVIFTTLHSGAKFSGKAYNTSGGLHGVGISVVNALSEELTVEVASGRTLYRQTFARGLPTSKLMEVGKVNRRGTSVSFRPDPEIFGPRSGFKPARLYRMARSKAYLFGGVEIRWSCDPSLLVSDETPAEAVLHFPGGLKDFLESSIAGRSSVTGEPFCGEVARPGEAGRVEWAIAWAADADGFLNSYCNTIPTPEGGTHEAGLKAALTKGLKAHGELIGNRRVQIVTAEDVTVSIQALLSVFIRNPEFQGQTKERLSTADAQRLVEGAIKDPFAHWLAANPREAETLIGFIVDRAEERVRRRQEKEVARKAATRKLRLPGKLADCARTDAVGTELFLVEGDSAGGSAKQARDRATQAILPLRGKILNVASAASGKLQANQEIADILLALGCGTRERYRPEDLRYERIVIMTDADVDGAHIASLLMTFFFRELPGLIRDGHLFLAVPPLYRLSQGSKTAYARDDAHKDELMRTTFSGKGKVEISRFKGLGEMLPAQLKETTMKPGSRTLLQVRIDEAERADTDDLVERLMGRKAELRFAYIQENASFVEEVDV